MANRAENLAGALLEAAPDAIIAVAADGRIVLANGEAERLFGYCREEVVGKPFEILVPGAARAIHPDHRADNAEALHPGPVGAGLDLAGRRGDGTPFPAEVSLSAIDSEGGTLVVAVVRDVTDRIEAQAEGERLSAQAQRERMEAHLQQSQRLDSLGSLAGGVAHDFNNLLGVIINYASFVSDAVTAAADISVEPDAGTTNGDAAASPVGATRNWDEARRDVEQIQQAAERASEITRQLLTFACRDVGRPRVLNLNDVVTNTERLLRRTVGVNIALRTVLEPGLQPVVADPGQIEKVLGNLALNARNAMPSGGTLTIETRNVDIDAQFANERAGLSPGPYVRLCVTDTGFGMGKEVADRAFEPFFTTEPKGIGTGLGLSTVYGIVTQAKGHVEIDSIPGLGTSVIARFPAAEPVPPGVLSTPGHTTAHRRGGRSETVLVVEDEHALREVTRRMLVRHGYTVLTAANGIDAWSVAREYAGKIHLLLTDVIMPFMLGRELVENVKEIRPEIAVLYMSGYARPILGTAGKLEPGLTLLEKPFTEPVLLNKVREVLDNSVTTATGVHAGAGAEPPTPPGFNPS